MKNYRCIYILTFFLLFQGYSTFVFSETDHQQIIKRSDEARGNLSGVKWLIEINALENGEKRHRRFKIKSKGFNSVAAYTFPPNVKGRKLLMVNRNMWFYKPGLRKPVPISPRQKLLGNASNGDIASTNYAKDYVILSVTDDTVNGERSYLYDLKGKSKNVTYDRIRYWISKKRFVGIKAEYYAISGKMFKTASFEYKNIVKTSKGNRPFVSKMTIRNTFMNKNITEILYSKIRIRKVPDSNFNINLLMK